MGLAYNDQQTGALVLGLSAVRVNINPENGFLRLAALRDTNDCEWQQFAM